jgi:tetrahydromethanopterin S-methyltransferase subunit G
MSIIKNLGTIDRVLPKKDIIELAKNDATQVIESPQFDLLKVYVELKRYENYLTEVIEKIKPLALEVAQKQGEKTFGYDNAKVNVQNRISYDFSNDDKWVYLNQSLTTSQTEIKKHQEILKNLTEVKELVDEATGELYQVFPPERTQNSLLVVSF